MISAIVSIVDKLHLSAVFLVVVLAGIFIVAALRLAKVLRPLINKAGDFFDDWGGVEDRPGFTGHKGAMERLMVVESELKNNGGHSLRDQTDRLELNQQILNKQMNIIGMRLGVEPTVIATARPGAHNAVPPEVGNPTPVD